MHEPSLRRDLLDQVELVPVRGQHRYASLGRCQKTSASFKHSFRWCGRKPCVRASVPVTTPASAQTCASGVKSRLAGADQLDELAPQFR
jgi:hypothetical protein